MDGTQIGWLKYQVGTSIWSWWTTPRALKWPPWGRNWHKPVGKWCTIPVVAMLCPPQSHIPPTLSVKWVQICLRRTLLLLLEEFRSKNNPMPFGMNYFSCSSHGKLCFSFFFFFNKEREVTASDGTWKILKMFNEALESESLLQNELIPFQRVICSRLCHDSSLSFFWKASQKPSEV